MHDPYPPLYFQIDRLRGPTSPAGLFLNVWPLDSGNGKWAQHAHPDRGVIDAVAGDILVPKRVQYRVVGCDRSPGLRATDCHAIHLGGVQHGRRLRMQQTLQPDFRATPMNVAGTRRRIIRNLIGGSLVGVALSSFAVVNVKVWRGPNYGILIESRGDLLWEWLYRADKHSVECSVWRIYEEEMIAAPIVLIRTGGDNHVEIGDGENW